MTFHSRECILLIFLKHHLRFRLECGMLAQMNSLLQNLLHWLTVNRGADVRVNANRPSSRGLNMSKEVQLSDLRPTTNSTASDAVDLCNSLQDTRQVLGSYFEVNAHILLQRYMSTTVFHRSFVFHRVFCSTTQPHEIAINPFADACLP